jgi:hypothetical protein
MAKIDIPPVRGGYNLTQINSAIQLIAKHLNEKVLYRDSPSGEPNQMLTDIDMNGKYIYNVPAPVNETDLVRKKDLDELILAFNVVLSFNPDDYVSKTDFDDLLLRVEALEGM